ncbi:MAG: hypothetical protein ACLTBV_31920 [Enterocloster bolteae]
MIRMDMAQMVRQAVDTAGPDVSVNRDKGDDRSGTDFLRMLRGRQQALDRRETEERLSKKGRPGISQARRIKRIMMPGNRCPGGFHWRLLRQTQAMC